MTHELKTWPEYFAEIESGAKSFEIRHDDRGFKVGDTLILNEWNPDTLEGTGRSLSVKVEYLTSFGQPKGQVVMSIAKSDAALLARIAELESSLKLAFDDLESARANSFENGKAAQSVLELRGRDKFLAEKKAEFAKEREAFRSKIAELEKSLSTVYIERDRARLAVTEGDADRRKASTLLHTIGVPSGFEDGNSWDDYEFSERVSMGRKMVDDLRAQLSAAEKALKCWSDDGVTEITWEQLAEQKAQALSAANKAREEAEAFYGVRFTAHGLAGQPTFPKCNLTLTEAKAAATEWAARADTVGGTTEIVISEEIADSLRSTVLALEVNEWRLRAVLAEIRPILEVLKKRAFATLSSDTRSAERDDMRLFTHLCEISADALSTPAPSDLLAKVVEALEPLRLIADQYDANALDDEARKVWGPKSQFINQTPFNQIELYSGRGGRQLLTLQHCMDAREALRLLGKEGK